jgi:hypothetical protein
VEREKPARSSGGVPSRPRRRGPRLWNRESQHPDTMFRLPAGKAVERKQQQQGSMLIVLSRLGIFRLFNMAPADVRLPADAQTALNMAKNSTDTISALQAELLAIRTNRHQLPAAGDLGSIPLRVVSATQHGMSPDLESYTGGLQRELTTLSSNSQQDVVTGADHASLVSDENNA